MSNKETFQPLLDEYGQLLRSASHHYADDSGKEWGLARKFVREAKELRAKTLIDHPYLYDLFVERSKQDFIGGNIT